VNLLVEAAARELKSLGTIPFATYCSDTSDGRTQGTPGMFESLALRNDAAVVFRRQIRSLPTRRGVLGGDRTRACPMMMALAAMHIRRRCSRAASCCWLTMAGTPRGSVHGHST
jgi:dihydroxyacid dehydratase/phosphogluconate dehydratase